MNRRNCARQPLSCGISLDSIFLKPSTDHRRSMGSVFLEVVLYVQVDLLVTQLNLLRLLPLIALFFRLNKLIHKNQGLTKLILQKFPTYLSD